MKKFESLGRSLSKGEQKNILGGLEDELLPCGQEGVKTCNCAHRYNKWNCMGQFK